MSKSTIPLTVGQYTEGVQPGFSQIMMNLEADKPNTVMRVSNVDNPSYITQSPLGFYAISEKSHKDNAALYFFDNTMTEQAITLLKGDYPCHVSLSECHQFLGVSHYGSGSFDIFSLTSTGHIGHQLASIYNTGKGQHPTRQQGPRGHQLMFIPRSNTLVTVDLGIDELNFYHYASNNIIHQQRLSLPSGSGPRHLVFTQDGLFGFVLCELDETLCVIERKGRGEWRVIHSQQGFPEHECKEAAGAIKLSPDERYVYITGRGQSVISWFDITSRSAPRYQGYVASNGVFPRDIGITQNGLYLIAANQHSNNLAFFSLDKKTGQPTLMPETLALANPVCVLIGHS
ncbi:hypothetical protein BCU70_16810 [Vibrio sp. 10N.286.49.C2]|uniref:lactonase family protein n=1 Tax=unclassified Vibrio TaxID=2614977 RepID=UPI000C857F11|nr:MULTISPECIES: beta-propeller fold lactonase family protein [unclassified Vibrio]PMH37081.1 hypothetical protein BCU70_16810 [Vibrio sp. 10N.286.49.C2]PMH49509.1 hypothetical protein BCU66_20005 [Vibrio sp. 10N.286.49.B1]PMH82789.1 hypothetical protein BCU58_17020 [Vibrio sp. 10N.286.48.B7]